MRYGSSAQRGYTIEEFERLPDDGTRRDLVAGMVVREPLAGGRHGLFTFDLAYYLKRYLEGHPVGAGFGAETGFALSLDPQVVRGPDAAIVLHDRIPEGGVPLGYFPGAPDFCVEVVSPSNTAEDVQAKVRDYLAAGTRLIWVVHPKSRTVMAYRSHSDIEMIADDGTLRGHDVLPGFELSASVLFGSLP